MTEKRFECDKGSRIIIDNETKLHYIMTLDWECSLVTKLLNHFAEENEQLKQDLSEYCNFSLHDVLDKKNKEIEQLKNQNDNLVDMIARVQYRADLIKEENEQLKQLVNIADDLIDKLGSETMQNEWIKNF